MKKLSVFILLVLIIFSGSSLFAQQKVALLIGISDYHAVDQKTGWDDIHGVNDVKLLSPVLKSQGFSVDHLTDADATYDNIVKQLKSLAKKVNRGSVVYIHFSTHGQPFEDINHDETDGWDESIVPVDARMEYKKGVYEGAKHLLDDELNTYTEAIRVKVGPAGRLYVVVDACHAGKASRGFYDEVIRGTKQGFSPNGLYYKPKRESETHYDISYSANKAPVVYLEACKSTQYNSEIKKDGTYYGALSYYIYQVVSKHAIGVDASWVYKVQELMRQDNSLQDQDMVIEISKIK
mgnify:CR=1 FL=1